jgi:hypothetical protein
VGFALLAIQRFQIETRACRRRGISQALPGGLVSALLRFLLVGSRFVQTVRF